MASRPQTAPDLAKHLSGWKPFRAVVVGDVMLDQLVFGNADRLSADAPVPVLHVQRTEHRPGGAANVAMDLAAMRADVSILAVVGTDDDARLLRGALSAAGVGADSLVEDATRPTTVKRSLIGLAQHRHPQKMFRVDHESRQPIAASVEDALVERFEHAVRGAAVVCLEDYDKGLCTPSLCRRVIEAARRFNVPVFVDPARTTDYSKYRGATAVTPNRTEAEVATGLMTDRDGSGAHNAALARALAAATDAEAVVLTLDRHGALLLERGQDPLAVPTIAREVYDVTGAGDMFLSGLAAARANALSWPDAVALANAAAGLEVEVFGVVPIPIERVHVEMLRQLGLAHGKVRTPEQAAAEAAARRARGESVVFTNGCFDLLHAGHVSLLDEAAAQGDFLIVGLNDDASVRTLKGEGRPINTAADRARVLGALESVDAIVLFGEATPIRLIEAVAPDVLVKGADYSRRDVVGGDLVESRGGRVHLAGIVEGKSTTSTIASLRRS